MGKFEYNYFKKTENAGKHITIKLCNGLFNE